MLAVMIPIYHDICGRGMVMELDFAIDRRGLVPDSHAAVYLQLGNWVRECYGRPLAMVSGQGDEYVVTLRAGEHFDRFQLQENTLLGQRIRQYTIESQPAAAAAGTSWKHIVSGQAIGTKRIILLPGPAVTVASGGLRVRLRVVRSVAKPILRFFGVFQPCFPNATMSYK